MSENAFYPSGKDTPQAGDFVADLRRSGRTGVVLMRNPEDIRVYWFDMMQEVIEHVRVPTSVTSPVVSVDAYMGVAMADHLLKEVQRAIIGDLEGERAELRKALELAKRYTDPGATKMAEEALAYKAPERVKPADPRLYVKAVELDVANKALESTRQAAAQRIAQLEADLAKAQQQARLSAEAYTLATDDNRRLSETNAGLRRDFDQAKIDVGIGTRAATRPRSAPTPPSAGWPKRTCRRGPTKGSTWPATPSPWPRRPRTSSNASPTS